jgi:hypothetical protein
VTEIETPAWMAALPRSYDEPLVFVTDVLGITPEGGRHIGRMEA